MKTNAQTAVNALRVLAADAVQKAKSGHPGIALGIAPAAFELWSEKLCHNPANADWLNRDRFILSGGHGSSLLYSLLHIFGYGLTMDDIKNFRQLDSKTPGHPEYGNTVGVDATTGPLGAGIAMAVGMAMAEEHLAATFNKPGFPVIDHYTYAICGDGCMMEGISSEAFSLAGTLGLSKLIILYDSNNITIEGSTDLTFTEDVCARMAAFGFDVFTVEDGNDLDAIGAAIDKAKASDRPSFIEIKTIIGYGCPAKQGKSSSHGEPLGEENVAALRETLGWTIDEPFTVPQEVYDLCAETAAAGAAAEAKWNEMLEQYFAQYPDSRELWDKYFGDNDLSQTLLSDEVFWARPEKAEATRTSSGNIIARLAEIVPNMMGGSADLGPSNKTYMKDKGEFSATDRLGKNIHYGVRELAMAAIGNGLLLHGGVRPFVATFFVFSDYTKPMARLSALMRIPSIYIFSHDSIGVGEDGATHEPIEQLAMFRSMPNFNVWRPCDAIETAAAWYSAMTAKETPCALALTRQNIPQQSGSSKEALRGGYVIEDCDAPQVILIASGSEVAVAVDAKARLAEEGIAARVVSMPCMEVFEQQSEEYKQSVLPKDIRCRVAVEAGASFGWERYTGLDGKVVAIDTFGKSAPYSVLFEHFGFTADNVVNTVKELL